MRKLKHILAFLVMGSLLSLSSCKPDKKDDNVISRFDLPMSGQQEVPVRNVSAYGSFDVKYNTKEEIDIVVKKLKEMIELWDQLI